MGLIGGVCTWSLQSDRRSDSVHFASPASFVAGIGCLRWRGSVVDRVM